MRNSAFMASRVCQPAFPATAQRATGALQTLDLRVRTGSRSAIDDLPGRDLPLAGHQASPGSLLHSNRAPPPSLVRSASHHRLPATPDPAGISMAVAEYTGRSM